MSSFPFGFFLFLALCFALSVSYWGVVVGALNRLTRADAQEAENKGQGGPHILAIFERRLAAVLAASFMRSMSVVVMTVLVVAMVYQTGLSVWIISLLSTAIAAAVLVLLGLLGPQQLGYKYPIRTIASASGPLWLLTRFVSTVVKHREPEEEEERVERQEDQLAVMVERVSESDVVEDDERELLHSVFELSDTYVREVMVPRTDMITISAEVNLDKALSLFSRSGFSRVPVIGENVDDLLGVLYLKDVIRRMHHRNDADGVVVRDVMREAAFVPEAKLADDMLHEMQANAVHIALVVDEYGGIAGLVTIEDLLEELVGEMTDEHDRAEPEVELLSEPDSDELRYRVPARMAVDELGELFDLSIEDDDVDTVGGLLAKALGRIPITGSSGQLYGLDLAADRFEGRRKRLSTVIVQRSMNEEAGVEND